MRKWKLVAAFVLTSNMMGLTSFAGQWINDAHGWWYNNGDGTWPANTWQWIDGNRDNIAECYYFGADGYMLANTNTPDNYVVDANGAWLENGAVQTKYVGKTTAIEGPVGASTATTNSGSGSSSNSAMSNATIHSGSSTTINSSSTDKNYYSYSDDSNDGENENVDLNEYAQECFELINKKRAAAGVDELEWDDTIAEACGIRAEELAEKFSHLRPNGDLCFTAFDEVGITLTAKAENIAEGYSTPKAAVNAWMNSKGHKANILNKSMTRSAIGVYYSSDTNKFYWVQMFGRKRGE